MVNTGNKDALPTHITPIRVAMSCQFVGGLYSDASRQCGAGPGIDVKPIVRHRSMYTIDTRRNQEVMRVTLCFLSMKSPLSSAMPGKRAVSVSLTGLQGEWRPCSGITRNPISNNGSAGVCTYVAKLTVTVVRQCIVGISSMSTRGKGQGRRHVRTASEIEQYHITSHH